MAGAVVARVTLAISVVVVLDAGSMGIERLARLPVEALLAEFLSWIKKNIL